MSLHTDLQGRLRNTPLPKSHGLWPVFETVVNSIHSLEEQGNIKTEGKITLRISRGSQASLELDGESRINDIEGFVVEDNGIGFNDTNMESFETLDSDHKIDKGCKGVGRLLWLKAFDRVEINSDFKDSQGKPMNRVISFDAKNGAKLVEEKESINKEPITRVTLHGFNEKYQEATPKTIDSISRCIARSLSLVLCQIRGRA